MAFFAGQRSLSGNSDLCTPAILETCPSWQRSVSTALTATAFSGPCGRPESTPCSTSASGAEYAGPITPGLTSQRLQTALSEAGLTYEHHRELAPTTELRRLQYREDDRLGVGKRSRSELASEYVRRYREEILDQVDLESIIESLLEDGAAALLCVERDPEACHRSLIAERLAERHGVTISHIRPD